MIDSSCNTSEESRFDLIKKAARRAHDLSYGVPSAIGSEAKGHKPSVVALMEIEQGVLPKEDFSSGSEFDSFSEDIMQ